MNLLETLAAAGMTPPRAIVPGRWVRFPGVGKSPSNRSGWCKIITPTLAIYGDWSSNLSEVWKDQTHRDEVGTEQLLARARERSREYIRDQQHRQKAAAAHAKQLVENAVLGTHPYLESKGFPHALGLVHQEKLLVPVRDHMLFPKLISVQQISPDGEKRFLIGSRTRGGVHRLGAMLKRSERLVLCEGYATGLSVDAALRCLPGAYTVVVCFSARNLECIAKSLPTAVVCADHDESGIGQESAERTGLRWVMPPEIGDFNDLHQQHGIRAVTEILRGLFQQT